MFLQNKYTKWYNNIVSSAQARSSSGYVEKHHIIPKCLGGTNNTENLVELTAREHFICHWLLTKMVSSKRHNYQLWNALSSMLYFHNPFQSREKISSQKYQLIKKHISEQRSIHFSGENNAMFGKKHSGETREKMRLSHLGVRKGIPGQKQSEATKAKRSISQKGISKPKLTCEHCGKTVGSHGNYMRWHGAKCKLNTLIIGVIS